jgi:hypothetical protein
LRSIIPKSSVLPYACLWAKGPVRRIFIKKCFLLKVGSVYLVKRFTTWSGRSFADEEEVETEVRKWLRQQSGDFYAAGFDVLVEQWNKCINVGGGYVEK